MMCGARLSSRNGSLRIWLWSFGPGSFSPFNSQDLFDNFIGLQISFPSFQPAGAEFAAVGAANLSRDAKGMPIAGFAVKGRAGRDEDAFNQRMIAQPPEKLLRRIMRALFLDQFERSKSKVLSKLL